MNKGLSPLFADCHAFATDYYIYYGDCNNDIREGDIHES